VNLGVCEAGFLTGQMPFLLLNEHRATTSLENMEMSGNLTAVKKFREFSQFTKIQGSIKEKSCHGKLVYC